MQIMATLYIELQITLDLLSCMPGREAASIRCYEYACKMRVQPRAQPCQGTNVSLTNLSMTVCASCCQVASYAKQSFVQTELSKTLIIKHHIGGPCTHRQSWTTTVKQQSA